MQRLRLLARRLGADRGGVAMIEFALAAPLFLTIVLAGLELTNLALAHLRVSQVAMTVADNAGRVTVGIDEAHIHEVFAGARVVASNLDFEDNGRVILSSLEDNGETGGNRGQMIRWQRCWGALDARPAYGNEGEGRGNGRLRQGMGRANNPIAASPGTAVMFVEANYRYQPILNFWFNSERTIRYETAFNVRSRQNQVISNTQDLDVMECD